MSCMEKNAVTLVMLLIVVLIIAYFKYEVALSAIKVGWNDFKELLANLANES